MSVHREGYYVRLRNTSTETVSLEGWSLSNESRSFQYEFGADQTLASGESLTLWCGTPQEYALLQRILRAENDGTAEGESVSPQLRRALVASGAQDAPTDLIWGVENAQLFDRGGDALSLWSPHQQCVDAKAVSPSGSALLGPPLALVGETKVVPQVAASSARGCALM